MSSKYHFAIDRGGTFTDVFAICPSGKVKVLKLLSEDPLKYKDAPTEAIRRILNEENSDQIEKESLIEIDCIGSIRMGTTIATNALLERKGAKTALLVTSGFKDLLHIGNQSRQHLFDLSVPMTESLYSEVLEVEERVILEQDTCCLGLSAKFDTLKSLTNDRVHIIQELNEQKLTQDLQNLLKNGIKSLAVIFIHSYLYPDHELKVRKIALEMGFENISLSSQILAMRKAVPRGYTACADAYLTPKIKDYVRIFASGFKNNLKGVNVLFMQSDGGLAVMNDFCGSRAILSGPAGGVVGHAITTEMLEKEGGCEKVRAVIGFDMGGTSTDVSRYAGRYEHVFETTISGVTIQAPQLDINTVAAGGGSCLFYRNEMFEVGPESAGAHPGPTCYGKSGPLTLTDANLCLGRLRHEYFPKIFGPKEDQPLFASSAREKFSELCCEINSQLKESGQEHMTMEQVAYGFIKVANETMCRPIRALTQGKGFDTSKHVLMCFGGAGGQHACAIARTLGIHTVYVHKYSGILSAYGLALADVVEDRQEPCNLTYKSDNFESINKSLLKLRQICVTELSKQGFTEILITPYIHLRYVGTECALMCEPLDSYNNREEVSTSLKCEESRFLETFIQRYKREFGFTLSNREVLVDDVRIRAIGKSSLPELEQVTEHSTNHTPEIITQCYFEEGYLDTPLYMINKLGRGCCIEGPAILLDKLSTILIEPKCNAVITKYGCVKICVSELHKSLPNTAANLKLNTVQLSIFSHRFMSIAEQMGRMLQRTAISTNIKERLDFSCALFGQDGGLVANAPHIPVHLGAMQEAVQYQMKVNAGHLSPGDVFLSNHPVAGGSHLPDLTVISPIFREDATQEPIFFVASRAHHADIGGISPGSMPPDSKTIDEEGVSIKSVKIIKGGVFMEEELINLLTAAGTRTLLDNISDLNAQIAANKKGATLIEDLILEYSLPVVQAYMGYIQENAELAVRKVLKDFASNFRTKTGTTITEAVDYMDDGTPIKLKVSLNENTGLALFDFTGTGLEVYSNTNAPRAVTLAAIIYCLRAMVGSDIPLNQGCLKPITLSIPPNTILSPSEDAAVVGGNVETSQRIVDVILKAFHICAASQGCMNNVTFGDENQGYYETVAGGAGAGPTWHGRSGVHTHMTNTRITDPEVLEQRYPVYLQRFCLNPNTGGRGKYQGGDGVVREIVFRKKLRLSLLTERRVFQPYGLLGGAEGSKGKNILILANSGRMVNLGGKAGVNVSAGDCLRLCTPGGGGYGKPCEDLNESNARTGTEIHPVKNPGVSSSLSGLTGSVVEYKRTQESV